MSSSYIGYQEINSLTEFPMIAGTDWVLTFNCYEDDGVTPQDIGGATITWRLSPYGQPDYNILEIAGVISDVSEFTVTVPAASTESFSGIYTQQPVIDSFFGQRYKPAQGNILVIPAIVAGS